MNLACFCCCCFLLSFSTNSDGCDLNFLCSCQNISGGGEQEDFFDFFYPG